MRALRRFLALSGHRRELLLRAVGWCWRLRVALWLQPYARVRSRSLRGSDGRPATAGAGEATVRDVTWAVRTAARVVPVATCLVQAMAAERMLRHRGLVPSLRIGVPAQAEGRFEAHAWLAWEGSVVFGDREDIERLVVLPDLPPGQR